MFESARVSVAFQPSECVRACVRACVCVCVRVFVCVRVRVRGCVYYGITRRAATYIWRWRWLGMGMLYAGTMTT